MSSVAEEVEVLRGARSATFKDLLTHRAFVRLLAAMSVSSFGDWVGFVAVTAIVANLGGGTALLAVAGVMIARTLPAFLFGPIAGTLVDRLDRKRLMIVADLARGAMYLSMVFLRELWAIYLLSFAIECLSLLWGPARDASLPNLVPRRQLTNANSLVLLSSYATLPIGGAAFAVLTAVSIWMGGRIPALATQPESLALLLDAGTFLFSASMVAGIAIRPQPSHTTQRLTLSRVWRDTKDGINFLRENSIASAMTGGIVVAFGAVGAVLAIGPVFVTSTLEAGPSGWGLVVTAFGVGMGLGMATAGQAAKVVDREIVFVWSLIAAAASLFVLATMPNLSWAIVFTVWLGAFCGLAWVSGYTLLQENVVDEFRGRTFGSLTTLSRMFLFLSLAAFPTLAQGFETFVRWIGPGQFYVGGNRIDLSGTRLALAVAGSLVVGAGINTRRLLKRYRLSRPVPLTLVPKLKRPPATGLFIAFEGVEGAGKGTQIAMAEAHLRSLGLDVLVTREPGGTAAGEQIRELLLDPGTGKLDARAEALLFAAARAQTVASVIRPALAEGKVVICDRYVDSSLAYQGWARGLGEPDVLSLNVWATQGLFPDMVILLHLEPELGLARSEDEPRDRMEQEGQQFLAKVADAYLKIAEEHPERFVVVDANRDPASVFDSVRDALERAVHERDDHHPTN
ncbi:MAG: dTMP kinase [Actinobacteria bacterium]|nr:MAG: dTMP kinase [Actinomycetota bacterium]